MIIVCYHTCWGCKFGQCYDEPTEHPWWDQDDVDYNASENRPAPEGNCACSCGRVEHVNFNEKYYDNDWTFKELDKFLKMKVDAYLKVIEKEPSFQQNCSLLTYLGFSPENYVEWLMNNRINTSLSRAWPKPKYDWSNGL